MESPRSPPPTSSSTPSSSPTTPSRTLGCSRPPPLDGGADSDDATTTASTSLRPAVDPDPARLLQRSAPAVRQLGVLRVPQQALRQRRRQAGLEPGRRLPGWPDMYSTQAISSMLKPKGGFVKNYARFASANLLPSKLILGSGLAEHCAGERLHAHQEPPQDRQARPPAAAHVFGQLADQSRPRR